MLTDLNVARLVECALGFASGTALGITIEGWIGEGHFLAHVICRERSQPIRQRLRSDRFGVASVVGQGIDTPREILFLVSDRKRASKIMEPVRSVDQTAFVTIGPVLRSMGGFLPHLAPAASLRK